MNQKTFTSPHWPNRPITTKVTNEFLTFHYLKENDREFYSIVTDEWVRDVANIVEHMERKVWFTSVMRKFINSSLNIADSGKELRHDKWTQNDECMQQRANENSGWISLSDIIEIVGDDKFKNGEG